MDNSKHICELFEKYLEDKATIEETEQLLAYFGNSSKAELQELIRHELNLDTDTQDQEDVLVDEKISNLYGQIKQRIDERQVTSLPVKRLKTWMPYAAAVLIFISIGFYLYQNNVLNKSDLSQLSSKYGADVLPGTHRATLTLADGSTYLLSEEQDGVIIRDDELLYEDGTSLAHHNVAYATLVTPKGGQYKIILPDGSLVLLNAASSIKYPTQFAGNERKVELSGEAYFEVNHLADQPFIVESSGQRVEVLGTSFNINAYPNEPVMSTTLVDGKVNVKNTHTSNAITILPGQQTTISGRDLTVQDVETAAYVSWKDGYFQFDGTDLTTILRQLERWYDIEVDYTGIPDRRLFARINRSRNLSAVLNAIEETSGIRFNINERRLSLQKE